MSALEVFDVRSEILSEKLGSLATTVARLVSGNTNLFAISRAFEDIYLLFFNGCIVSIAYASAGQSNKNVFRSHIQQRKYSCNNAPLFTRFRCSFV